MGIQNFFERELHFQKENYNPTNTTAKVSICKDTATKVGLNFVQQIAIARLA